MIPRPPTSTPFPYTTLFRSFSITPGAATQLAFSQQPGTTVANRLITPAVKVRALDALGDLATSFGGKVSGTHCSHTARTTARGSSPERTAGAGGRVLCLSPD